MTISQLEYLIAVANHRSFSMAAKYCNVSQPSLSVQIQNLEEELGLVLFDRSTKPITPTNPGMAIIEQARIVMAEFCAMKEKADEIKGKVAGKLTMAVIPTVAPYMLPRWIPGFIEQYPDVELDICDMLPADILEALDCDRIDIAIFSGGKLPARYRERKLFTDKFYVYLSPGHPLLDRTVVYEHDLDFAKLLFLTDGISQRTKRLEIMEARQKVKQHYTFRNTSLETLMRMVDSTSGMAADYVPAERHGQLKAFVHAGAFRTITLAVGRTCARYALIEAVSKSITEMAGRYVLADFLRT